MSQGSNSDARLAIDNETKAAPTTTSCQGTSCLPHPRFPKRMGCFEINVPAFEQGFDEQLVQGGIPNHMQCAICQGLPRRPATLDGCGHLFCERCIKQHFKIRAEPQTQGRRGRRRTARPACRNSGWERFKHGRPGKGGRSSSSMRTACGAPLVAPSLARLRKRTTTRPASVHCESSVVPSMGAR